MTLAMTPLDGELQGGRHRMAVRVYYEDTDFSGAVYHASYLRFMERGRTNYLRCRGVGHRAIFEGASGGFAFMVRSMQVDFRKPAHMDDLLEIVTQPQEVRGASLVLLQHVKRGDDVLVEARVRVACVASGRPRPLPGPLRAAMQADCTAAAQLKT
jgi:acyl-CoA thioester hydrolase